MSPSPVTAELASPEDTSTTEDGDAAYLLQEHFDQFKENISLNETRRKRIEAARNSLDTFLRKHWVEAALDGDIRRQGSFASHIVVRPLGDDGEYDIDLLLPIKLARIEDEVNEPADLLDFLEESLETHDKYEGKLENRERCIRINYEDDFHVDLVPGVTDLPGCAGHPDGVVKIPDSEIGEWKRTNPIRRTRWIKRENGGATHFRLLRLVKMLKHWRNIHLGDNPPSIVLSTLIAQNNPGGPNRSSFDGAIHFDKDSDALLLYDTVRMILDDLPGIIGHLENPILEEEDLMEKVGFFDYHNFRSELIRLRDEIEDALQAETKEEAVYQWKYIFGDRFPKKV